MRALRAIRSVVVVCGMSLAAATAAFFVWFTWKWGAHYAGVWWRSVRERLEAGDTTINQASWWMRDRWQTLGGVLDGPKIDAESAPQMLAVIGAASVAIMILRVPGSALAGWLGRRAIRRDGVLCDPALARRMGRRVYVDGALRWIVPAAVVWGGVMALLNHLWQFGEYMPGRESRMLAMALTPLVFLTVDVACSLCWARRVISKDIRGRQRMCRWCGYDVTSAGDRVCPECGKRGEAKGRDVGVRLLARPRGARLAVMAGVLVTMVVGGIGWVVANAKGISVTVEAVRLIDAMLLKRRDGWLRAYIPPGRVMELRFDDSIVYVRMHPEARQSGDPAVWRGAMLVKKRSGVERFGLAATPGRGTGVGDVSIYYARSGGGPLRVVAVRRVRSVKLVEVDRDDPDMAWLMEGK